MAKKKKARRSRNTGSRPGRGRQNAANFGASSVTDSEESDIEYQKEHYEDEDDLKENDGFSIDSFITNRREMKDKLGSNDTEDDYDFSI